MWWMDWNHKLTRPPTKLFVYSLYKVKLLLILTTDECSRAYFIEMYNEGHPGQSVIVISKSVNVNAPLPSL
jgi:hypothetical protein